ncbi:NAD(P)-dependent oxidoreductase [Mycolicibacterium sp. P9-22]|nr:NAD(P)-dependent oxidoreductase [Mycolicibacterium sp. P9-22]
MARMNGKVAFITGAARGQGRSHCLTLAREGAKIIGLDVCRSADEVAYPLATDEDLAETGRLLDEIGAPWLLMQGDVRDISAVQAVVDAGLEKFGQIDVVVANAGVWTWGETRSLPVSDWQFTIDLNLTGAFNTVRAVLPSMIDRGAGGSIMFTGSELAFRGAAQAVAYSASKAGLIGMMRALARELAPQSIRVNSIHPSTVNTDMVTNQATYDLFAPHKAGTADIDDLMEAARAMHILPLPILEAQDISNAVLYLASDESRAVTSISLPVDAGSTQKIG